VTLTDAGPLIAIINRNDPHHGECVTVLKQLPEAAMQTTWPCYTEAMHILRQAGGYSAQRELWKLLLNGGLILHELSEFEIGRAAELMEKYRDRPMDLADATLVAAAETLGSIAIFAIDRDFLFYRLSDGRTLQVIP
jgi:predicted nucleic acid-binding protein